MVELKLITYKPFDKEEWHKTESNDEEKNFFFMTKFVTKKDLLKFNEGQSLIIFDGEYKITKTIFDVDNIQWFIIVEPSTGSVPIGLIYGY
jgi:hypothetical protein